MGSTAHSGSLWRDGQDGHADGTEAPAPVDGVDALHGSRYDTVVVGAGLTGLSVAALLSGAGQRVVVLEARGIGAGATGGSTAKISLLQGTKLSRLAARHPVETVRAYVEANADGARWLLGLCRDRGVPVQERPAVTYASAPESTSTVRAELAAARSAGLDAQWLDDAGLPFPTFGAVRLDGQAQFDPMDALRALREDVLSTGGHVVTGVRVRGVRRLRSRSGGPHADDRVVETSAGLVRAAHVVLATGTPVLDRGGHFARLEALRSYALAYRGGPALAPGMYLSASSPSRSLRTAPDPAGGELLLAGGEGHVVGREDDTSARVAELERWVARYFPGAVRTHAWSAQDYRSSDQLPIVGRVLPWDDRVLAATGYDKWGMTNAVAAAFALRGEILGDRPAWAHALDGWRPGRLRGLPTALRLNAGVAAELVRGWARARNTAPVAVCTVDGATYRRSAVCPHLGGVLRWNAAERSWDCPLHGSRFAASGEVLEGPATSGLSPAHAAD